MIPQANILWVSDLHLKTTNNCSIKNIYNNRNIFIQSLIDKLLEENFTHLIFSGDLVFSGEEDQYLELYEEVINIIISHYPDIRLIICPGNHDFQWNVLRKNENIFIKYTKENNYAVRRNIESINELSILFANYINFYKRIEAHNSKFIENFEVSNITKFKANHTEIQSNGLFGVFIDHKYKLLFIYLNSSWYSWGTKNWSFLLKSGPGADYSFDTEKFMNSVDLGNLVCIEAQLVWPFLKKLNDNDYKLNLHSYLKIGVIHHPFNWFSWGEWNSNTEFQSIVDFVDIFLTSHTHSKLSKPTNYKLSSLIFESPQLMEHDQFNNLDDQKTNSISLKNNIGYSILYPQHFSFRELNKHDSNSFISKHNYNVLISTPSVGEDKNKYNITIDKVPEKYQLNRRISMVYSALSFKTFRHFINYLDEKKSLLNTNFDIHQFPMHYISELEKFYNSNSNIFKRKKYRSYNAHVLFLEKSISIYFLGATVNAAQIDTLLFKLLTETKCRCYQIYLFDFQVINSSELNFDRFESPESDHGIDELYYSLHSYEHENNMIKLKVNLIERIRANISLDFNEECTIHFNTINYYNYENALIKSRRRRSCYRTFIEKIYSKYISK